MIRLVCFVLRPQLSLALQADFSQTIATLSNLLFLDIYFHNILTWLNGLDLKVSKTFLTVIVFPSICNSAMIKLAHFVHICCFLRRNKCASFLGISPVVQFDVAE